jgi:hypothetical protein
LDGGRKCPEKGLVTVHHPEGGGGGRGVMGGSYKMVMNKRRVSFFSTSFLSIFYPDHPRLRNDESREPDFIVSQGSTISLSIYLYLLIQKHRRAKKYP